MNGVANFIKILASIVSSKITAVYLGPAGLAMLGQFMNVTSMAMTFSTVGINSGITKYTAEYYDDPKKRTEILSSGFGITMMGSVVVSLCVFFGRHYLSSKFLHTDQYASVFGILALTLILFALNTYFTAVLNGYKEFKKITLVNIIGSIVSLVIAILLVIRYGVFGAFLGVILSQTLIFFVTFSFVLKSSWFSTANFFSGVTSESTKKLARFSLMAFTSVFAVTFIQLQIRNFIIQNISIQDAGYWQGITRISDLYLSFITMTLSIYYLPKLSESKKNEDLRREILKGYAFILPLAIAAALTIYFLRGWIIHVLLAKSFLPMLPLFPMQLIGDVFKIASWLLGYLMIAKAMTKTFITTELTFGATLYLLTRFLVLKMGVVGATYAFAINYSIYIVVMFVIFRGVLFLKPNHTKVA